MNDDQLSDELVQLVRAHFPSHLDEARKLLLRYSGREADRVRRGIIALSHGRTDHLAHFTERAIEDYRDILYWSEHPDESAGGASSDGVISN